MRNTVMLIPLVALAVGLLSSTAEAAQAAPCTTIQWQPNRMYELRAKLHHAIHIVLPEPASGKPVAGNSDLWTVDGQSTHVFVKPTNADSAEGASTSLTIVGTSNTSYDFEIKRVRDGADDCVYIKKDGGLIGASNNWSTAEERQVAQVQKQMSAMQQQVTESREAAERKALDAVAEYRSRIYTRYTWGKGKGFIGQNVISDVYDDGRFTFIRVTQDNKGLMQVTARMDGRDELIEYDYDSTKKLYTLAGLYPEFTMTYNKSTIRIRREDDTESKVAQGR